jgi:hypothetical protein
MNEMISLVEKFGFPTVFCLWLMLRAQKRMDRLLDLVSKQTLVIVLLAKAWDIKVDSIESDKEE